MRRVLAFSGGVGGARLAAGLADVMPEGALSVAVNTGDDFEHLGLRISPDLDTVMYTLAGIENPDAGWGLAGESWHCLDSLRRLGVDDWFRLGDRDLATHLYRSERLAAGVGLAEVTAELCAALGVATRVLPMSDQSRRTIIRSGERRLSFQDYFVREACEPPVDEVLFKGRAKALPELLALLDSPELVGVVLGPSNPFVSLAPILSLPGVRRRLQTLEAPVVAVSPIVGGEALKGPAAEMMRSLGHQASATAVAELYADFLDGFVIDSVDASLADAVVEAAGVETLICDTIMRDAAARRALAEATLGFLRAL